MVTSALGMWLTESTKDPARYEEGEAAGQYRPDDIRGSYTFGEISNLFEIPLEDLAAAFALPVGSDPALFACKDLESLYGGLEEAGTAVGTSSVRLFVAWYRDLPYEIEEETYLLNPAVEILLQKADLTAEQQDYLLAHSVGLEASGTGAEMPALEVQSTPDAAMAGATLVPQEHAEETERLIKGKTTFREVLDWGVPQEAIESILGGLMPNPLTTIKDYCTTNGLEFSSIKAALQVEVDAVVE